MIVVAALTAHAQDREPTAEQLRQSTIQFQRTFLSSVSVGKVWEGTQHIYDADMVHVGYVQADESPTGVLEEKWVTWDSSALYSLPGEGFTLKHVSPWMTWDQILDALPAGENPITEMSVEYRQLNQAEVTALTGEFLPLTDKTLYRVKQTLVNADGSPSGFESPDQPPEDGWLLRVNANGVWQDHWTFYDSFEPDELADTFMVLNVTPANSATTIGCQAEDYYQWAKNQGAIWWSFVEHVPGGTVIVP